MKVGDFHHKKSGDVVPTCILDIGSADHFLMNAGHFHQKNSVMIVHGDDVSDDLF